MPLYSSYSTIHLNNLTINHNAGFFSCCTVYLQSVLNFFNMKHNLPDEINSIQQFFWYKLVEQKSQDIKNIYFNDYAQLRDKIQINYSEDVEVTDLPLEYQFICYKYLNFSKVKPFIDLYFSPSEEILQIIKHLESKYELNYENTAVLFLRGNDKKREIDIPSYDKYISDATKLYQENPNITFLIQSDETEFIQTMQKSFPNNHIVFWDEIRHIPRTDTTVDHVFYNNNHQMSKYFLSITYIMSKSKYILCNSGNCSLWIALFRGNADNMFQYCYRS